MEDFSYFHYERNLTGNYNEMSNLCWTGRWKCIKIFRFIL